MRTEGEAGTAFDAARATAATLLAALEPGDAVHVMTFDDAPRSDFDTAVHDLELARQQLNDLRPSHGGTAWPEALRAALTTLSTSNEPNARAVRDLGFRRHLGRQSAVGSAGAPGRVAHRLGAGRGRILRQRERRRDPRPGRCGALGRAGPRRGHGAQPRRRRAGGLRPAGRTRRRAQGGGESATRRRGATNPRVHLGGDARRPACGHGAQAYRPAARGRHALLRACRSWRSCAF